MDPSPPGPVATPATEQVVVRSGEMEPPQETVEE